MNLFTKQRLTDFENKLTVTKGELLAGKIDWEFGINLYTLLLHVNNQQGPTV